LKALSIMKNASLFTRSHRA